MGLAYDSGWVPVASGAFGRSIDCSSFNQLQIVIAASGGAGAGATAASWSLGAGGPVPWFKNGVNYSSQPPISGGFASVAAPAAGAANIYYIGVGQTGSTHLGDWVPQFVSVSTIAGAASWARIVIIGK